MTSAWFALIGLWIVTVGIMHKRYCTQSRVEDEQRTSAWEAIEHIKQLNHAVFLVLSPSCTYYPTRKKLGDKVITELAWIADVFDIDSYRTPNTFVTDNEFCAAMSYLNQVPLDKNHPMFLYRERIQVEPCLNDVYSFIIMHTSQ